MLATIEEVMTRLKLKKASQNGVICIFCGLPTAVCNWHRVFILRCHACGKEAPYLSGDIVELNIE